MQRTPRPIAENQGVRLLSIIIFFERRNNIIGGPLPILVVISTDFWNPKKI